MRLGRARTQLENTEHEREAATRARDAAWAEFRILLDRGLAEEVGLTADPDFAAAERVRDQVAITRRLVSPKGWPAGTAEQGVFVDKLLAELFRLNEDTRVRLEASGRSITHATDQSGLPAVGVLVDSTGSALGPRDASVRLERSTTSWMRPTASASRRRWTSSWVRPSWSTCANDWAPPRH